MAGLAKPSQAKPSQGLPPGCKWPAGGCLLVGGAAGGSELAFHMSDFISQTKSGLTCLENSSRIPSQGEKSTLQK